MDWKGLLSGVKKFSTGLGCIWLSVAFVVPMLGSFKLRRKIQCTTGYCPYLVDCYISRPTTSCSLEEPKTLMKMGLSVVLLGHVNFMLGALVHGVVLRHITLHKQALAMEYAISNVSAITSGLVGIVAGILAIVLSKNKRSRCLMWSLFFAGLAAALMCAASAIGLTVSVIRAIIHGGRSLLTHCRFPGATGSSSLAECPFDPTRIYSTTLILWVPLIVTCVVQLVFVAQCSAACATFLALPCCSHKKRSKRYSKAISVVRPVRDVHHARSEPPPPRSYTDPPKGASKPLNRYAQPARRYSEPPPPPRQPAPPARCPPSVHQSLLPLERRLLHPPAEGRQEATGGSQQRGPEQRHLLQTARPQRSSFWI